MPAFFDAYSKMERSLRGLEGAGEWQQLKKLFPPLAGKKVLDLGCGYGWHCRYAAEEGAKAVLGIDASERMIEKARSRGEAENIRYLVQSMESFDYPAESFDLVFSNLALHYVQDIRSIYQNVWNTLVQGGVFLFNIEHPVFTAGVRQQWVSDGERNLYWPVDDYYFSGKRETEFLGHRVVKQHRTLTEILMGLIDAGFSLEAVEEAVPPQNMMHIPGMADEMRRPMMLLVKARKA